MGILFIIVLVAIFVIALSHNRSAYSFGGGGHHQCGPYHHGTYDATTTGPQSESPLDILAGRYARGEIGRDEYLEKKQALEV